MKIRFVNFCAVLSAILIFIACTPDNEGLNTIEVPNPIPSAIYYNYNIDYNDSGLTQVKMTGRVLEQYNGTKEKEAFDNMKDSVHLWFYDEDMKVQSELIADRATRNRATGYMEAFGNVIVYNEKGEKLETEHLIWNEKDEKIISNDSVQITKKDQIIRGTGLISDKSFLDYEIQNVHGVINIKREDEEK